MGRRYVPYGTGTTVRCRTLQGCCGPVQMLHYALHCIASLPSSASDTPVPPLGLFYLRSIAVVAGLELQVLVPSGPAPGPAACSYGSLSSQPIPLITIQQDPWPRTNFLCIGPRLASCMLAVHAPSRHGYRSPGQSTAQRNHSTTGLLRCNTIILQRCGSNIQHSTAERSTEQSGSTGRRPSFKDPPWPQAGRLGNVTRGLACAQSHEASPQFHLA